ncbi:UPF0182 family protein [Micropruina sonneratiae]|uniref:UPF0182 family membrane protein n=1 Tax=Micropruina sonneratiae TaxID=2986940 RepID=UPI00222798EB|nr:UPF0182 family protein [Micropruina sp. KQZ13P-5]MCW3157487.1 UPF0182 family protein [Micropruina sp. KQZ13P-5]
MSLSASVNRRSPLLLTFGIAAVAVILFAIFTQIWTDKLWFDSISFGVVFSTELWVRVGLFVGVGAVMALLIGGNMWLAIRLRPPARRGGESAVLEAYRRMLEHNVKFAVGVPAVAMGVLAGMSATGEVLPVLAWLNRVPFGQTDPYFGLDYGFYVFELPVWQSLLSFLLTAVTFSLIAAAVVHFATGGVRAVRNLGRPQLTQGALVHLSVLAGVLLVLYGLQSLLDRYGLLLTQGTLFTGMHYTDDQARAGAKLVMAVIAFLVAALFFANPILKRAIYPAAAVVLMVISGLILTLIYPAVVQSFVVAPNQPDKENPYMQRHIDMTRQAFGIADTEITEYEAVTQVRAGQLKADAEALPGIRLMDPAVIGPTYEQLQQVRGYYTFPDVLDVDRYKIDGAETDVVVAAREMNLAGLPDQNWNNIHTVYTHGYGLVMAYGNRRQTGGEPEWIVRDIPPEGVLGDFESRIYFGEQSTQYAIVGREEGQDPIELDTPNGKFNVYSGKGGVPIGDAFSRALHSARFMDINLLLSDRVNSQSRILYNRTPKERVEEVAPWLTLDSNIYPAVVDGRTVWIVDGYTTSGDYPNSQLVNLRNSAADTQSRAIGAQIDENINYIRNSVKAVVDAYDGTVTLYAWDESDPLLQAYSKAFPGTVQPKSAISADLLSHLRYPEDLFKVQREILGRYHMTNPYTWYAQSDLWQVPNDPVQADANAAEPPYYLSIKWPTDDDPVFSQTSVFVPRGRSNLASYLSVIAEATSPDYGKLRVLRMSDTHQIDGPGQTFNAINTDPTVAETLRPFLNQGAASATYGNLLTLPMGNGLLYVAPIYTQRQGNTGSYPALAFVVVRFGSHVGIGTTLQEALDKVFAGDAGADTGEKPVDNPSPSPSPSPTGTSSPSPTTSPTGTSTASPEAVAQLEKAQAAFTAADEALRKGDLATYQAKVDEAKAALAAALKLMGR